MQRNHGLDLAKTICSFMIICIHAPFPGLVGDIITPLTRIAVPLFFMITGYYYSYTKERNREKNQLKKIFRLFVGSNLLYFIWSLLIALVSGKSVITTLSNEFNMKSILKFVLLNDSPFSGHLWYLSAILYVLLIIYFFEKKWNRQKLYPIVPFLLIADLVFGKYSLLLFGQSIPYVYVRNFICVGLPYFLIGDWIYTRNIKTKPNKALIFIFLFSFTTLAERFLLGAFSVNAERDHYISTTFLAVFVFLLAIQHKNMYKNKALSTLSYIGANFSTSIYILHPIVIYVTAKAIAYVSRYIQLDLVYSYIAPFVIFTLTTILSLILHMLTKEINKKRLSK